MYNVSDKFKTALKSSSRNSSIYGTLTTIKGDIFPLDDSSIIRDSLYITNQIVNNNKLTFGAVYAGECGLVINSTIDRYSLFGAKIELNFLLRFEDGTEELLPLGVFYVDTPERIGSKIKLIAVDNMSKLDVTVDEDVNGTWYELISYISDKCGVELAQTQEELEALHINTTSQTYTIQQEKIDTYRDALAFMCMIICANATIDNAGKLKIVQYATTPCDSNDRNNRLNNCKFSDYTTRYAGITARFFANENYAPYTAVDEDIDGLMLNLGDIPIVGGTADSKNETIQAMLDTLKLIEYVPATLYISSNPAYELGDMIKCNNINNTTDSVNTYVMAYKYDYRKKETINCYGDNPLLQNIKDKSNNINTSDIEAQIASKDMVIVNATNVKDITIGQILDDVVTLNFSVHSDCRPICIFTIPFNIDVDGYVEFSLYNGLVALENATYKGYYEKGSHFASFMYLDDMKQGERHSIRVMVRCYADITSATRTQEARLKALENGWSLIVAGTPTDIVPVPVDTTEPVVTIAQLEVKAIAYTQGINSGKGEWDGTLEFTDEFGSIPLSNITFEAFDDTVELSQLIPVPIEFAETFTSIPFTNVTLSEFNETVAINPVIKNYVFDTSNGTYDSDYVTADDVYMLKTEYEFTSTEQTIDSGRMCAVSIDTTPFVSVESVVVECVYASDDVLYLVKADGKLYTVVDDALSELTTTDIVAQTFLDYGTDEIPNVTGLSNPEVLCWTDSEDDLPTLTSTVTATPYPQTVISLKCDLSDVSITGIESMLATCEGELICAVSFDDKATWKAHNGAEWVALSDEYVGMSKETLEAITLEQWNELYSDASGMYIRFVLNDTTQSVTKIEIDFSN